MPKKQMPNPNGFLLHRTVAAERYNVSLDTLDELISSRKLPSVRIGRAVRVLKTGADSYFESIDQSKEGK